MTADALAVSRESRAALVDTGGRFLVSDQMAARAKELGMQAGGLYFRGRTGALGEVSSHAATAILGIFPHWVIDLTWRESAALPAATADGHVRRPRYLQPEFGCPCCSRRG